MGIYSISATCYDSIYVIFKLLRTYNIYRILIAPSWVVAMAIFVCGCYILQQSKAKVPNF
jgi:hypothetical protein